MLVEICPERDDVLLEIAYATENNFMGKAIYSRPGCYLHPDAFAKLERARDLAKAQGYKLKIFDAFRPAEAQWELWKHTPDPTYVAHPSKGGPHGRGVAIDLTLTDMDGKELDMGGPFDDLTGKGHHGCTNISIAAQGNRCLLLGIMTSAGWDCFLNEWWHYQLFNARATYPLLSDTVLSSSMVKK